MELFFPAAFRLQKMSIVDVMCTGHLEGNAITTKHTKFHEETLRDSIPSCIFVSLVVKAFSCWVTSASPLALLDSPESAPVAA